MASVSLLSFSRPSFPSHISFGGAVIVSSTIFFLHSINKIPFRWMFGRDDARHDKLKHQQKWNGVERGHGLSAIYISAISILRIESLHWDSCWDSFDSMKLKIKNIFELSGGQICLDTPLKKWRLKMKSWSMKTKTNYNNNNAKHLIRVKELKHPSCFKWWHR